LPCWSSGTTYYRSWAGKKDESQRKRTSLGPFQKTLSKPRPLILREQKISVPEECAFTSWDDETKIAAGLIGCGAIGTVIAEAIDAGKAGDIELVAIYDLVKEQAEKLVNRLKKKPRIANEADDLISDSKIQIVIEAASPAAVKQYAVRLLSANKDLMVMSAAALIDEQLYTEIANLAKNKGRKIYVPSGAIVGLDNIKSASIGNISEVTLTTRKPPQSFEGAPLVEQNHIDLNSLKKPLVLFEGSAKEAVKMFPQNVNVSATLSLAGIGPEKTKVRIITDPDTKVISHEIHVKGDFGEFETRTVNRPFPTNPKTSFIAALSAIATLKKISQNIIIGT
jgi:aspartate dehydrogenase